MKFRLAILLGTALLLGACNLSSLQSQPIVQEAVANLGPAIESSAASALNKELGNTPQGAALLSSAATALYSSLTNSGHPTAASVGNAVVDATAGQLPQTTAAILTAFAKSKSGATNTTVASLATLASAVAGAVPAGTISQVVAKAQAQ